MLRSFAGGVSEKSPAVAIQLQLPFMIDCSLGHVCWCTKSLQRINVINELVSKSTMAAQSGRCQIDYVQSAENNQQTICGETCSVQFARCFRITIRWRNYLQCIVIRCIEWDLFLFYFSLHCCSSHHLSIEWKRAGERASERARKKQSRSTLFKL